MSIPGKQLILLLCFVFSGAMVLRGQVKASESKVNGREAVSLENMLIRVSMLTGGGYLGELRLKSSDPMKGINPMRTPHYRTIDPQDYNPLKHDTLYGTGSDRKVMAGYAGHFLCFPYVGGMNSGFERELGYAAHGEAAVVEWDIERLEAGNGKATIVSSAYLPLSSYRVRRTLSLLDGQPVVLVEEEVENLEGFDRPYQWVQHITFGDPFIESGKTFADAPVSRIAKSADKDDPGNSHIVKWPMAKQTNGDLINAGAFNLDPGEGYYQAWLLDEGRSHSWFTVYNTDLKILVGYVLSKDWNPWVGDWRENGSKKHVPWDGEAVAWGLLAGTSPFTMGVKKSIDRGPVFGTPTYRWIGAHQKEKQAYLMFIIEIGNSFKGVESLLLEEGAIKLIERGTGKKIDIENDFHL